MRKQYKLGKHQEKALRFLKRDFGYGKLMILPTGSGKTLVSYARDKHLRTKTKLKTLIISENNLIPQSLEDYEKFYKEHKDIVSIVSQQKNTRLEIYGDYKNSKKNNILIMNYHTVINDFHELYDMFESLLEGYTLHCIMDEAEHISGDSSTSNKIKELLNLFKHILALTASPLSNKLNQTQTILDTIRAKHIPNKEEFYSKFCDIEIQQILQFNFEHKRVGYPVRSITQITQKSNIFKVTLWSFLRKLTYYDKLIVVSTENCEVELEPRKELLVAVSTGYEGKFKIVFKAHNRNGTREEVELSGWCSRQEQVKKFKNIKDYYQLVKKSMFSVSKKSLGDIPELTRYTKKLNINKESIEHKALSIVYEENKDLKLPTEVIAVVCPYLTLYEYSEIQTMPKHKAGVIIESAIKHIHNLQKKKEKIIIFTRYTTVAEYFLWYFKQNLKYNIGYIKGGMKKAELVKVKKEFNLDLNILLITEAGIRGQNLQICANTITLDLPISFGDLLQLTGRTSRLGSKHKKIYLTLPYINETILADIYKLIMGQGQLIKEFNEDLLEEGLLDEKISSEAIDEESSTYIRQGLKSRRKLYLNK